MKIQSLNKQPITNHKTNNKNISFGIFGIGNDNGSILCLDSALLVKEIENIARAKKIEGKKIKVSDGTIIDYTNSRLFQMYKFQNPSEYFKEKYGNNYISCLVKNGVVLQYGEAYMYTQKLQKGHADIILMNYLPIMLKCIKQSNW